VLLGDGAVQMMPDRGALDVAARRPATALLLFAAVAGAAVLVAGFALFYRTRRA
jgi:hypothetical protein